MKKYTFTINTKTQPKQRARTLKSGISYTPKETLYFENYVKFCYAREKYPLCQNAIWMDVVFYMAVPKSTSKKQKELMLKNEVKHTKKPDIDNLVKSIQDGLNGTAYKDDSQIYKLTVTKQYAEDFKTVVTVYEEE